MNKQEIEKALSWVKEVINHQVFERATYEDTYGTGDLSEEERKEVYEEMDNNINLFKTIQCALTQQLTNRWIPVSERLPDKDGMYLITSNVLGKIEVQYVFFQSNIQLFICNGKPMAWQPLPEPWKESVEE
jgi:hypothetical protein